MSLSQLPVELLLDIISYLLAPIKTISPWICSSEYNPELNYQDLSSLFALSVTNRRLFAIVTPVLREIAIAETRRIRIRSADYYSECIGHHPGPLFLAIWTGNLRLTQELFKYVPADELPAGGAKMPYMIEGYSHKELRYASVDFPSFDMIDVRYMDNDCWYPGPESLEYMPKLKCAWACPIPIRNAFLYTAIRAGHVDVARWLLDNMHLMGGGDTLHPFLVPQHAVASGNTEMLDMVRERCDPRWRDKCLLREAMLHHDVAMVRWILERGITGEVGTMQKFAQYWYTMMDVTVFEWACKFSSLEIVKLLVEHDSKRHDPEERVYWYEYDSINRKTRRWLAWVKELQRPDDPSTPNSKSEPMLLMWDCFQVTGTRPPGRIDSMKSNARNPFDPLENLLARNADWDLIKSVFERAPEKARSRARESMLHFAVREDRLDLARHLLYDLKIDVNALNKMGQVPLMSTESVEMLHLLMEAGADLLASPGNIESTSPIERLIRRPKVLKAALKYIPDLSSANGPMNALLRNPKHTTGQGWKNMRKAQIDRWLDSSGTVLLDAGVSMEGIEGHVKRYKDRLRAQQGGIGSSEVTDEDLEDVQSMMVLFGEVV